MKCRPVLPTETIGELRRQRTRREIGGAPIGEARSNSPATQCHTGDRTNSKLSTVRCARADARHPLLSNKGNTRARVD